MGNLICSPHDAALLTAVARDFCPFPDYSPSPLLNILSANSSQLLSEHYASVQASLTSQQQQDFTRSLRSTFGREGKVSHGGMGIVALSLAVLFDTVAREVKGEHVSDHEPVPGLFLKDPRGTYLPPDYTISRYLRLVPHIANNPTRMRDEAETFLHELKRTAALTADMVYAAQQFHDVAGVNLIRSAWVGDAVTLHLKRLANKTIDVRDIEPNKSGQKEPEVILTLNCDPKVASERFLTQLDSFGNRTKEAFKNCRTSEGDKTVMENLALLDWSMFVFSRMDNTRNETDDFDLKTNALGKWV